MRLIDADALKEYFPDNGEGSWTYNVTVKAYIDAQPAIDSVPVIRCKDCKWWKEYCRIVDGEVSDHACSLKRETDGNMHRAKADDYCSWAERKVDR